MLARLKWVPFESPTTIAGFSISGLHVLNEHSEGSSPAFGVPTSPVLGNASGEWTPPHHHTFLQWWAEGRQARPDDQLTEFLVRTAFANWELRILAHDPDTKLVASLGELQQRHQDTFLRTGLSQKFNQLVQFSACRHGVDHHLSTIKWLQSLAGLSWGKAEINLMLSGLVQAEANVDKTTALLMAWADLTAEEHRSALASWQPIRERFIDEFRHLYPRGFSPGRPAIRTPFVYAPSDQDVSQSLDPTINLGLELYDFYAGDQLSGIIGLFKSIIANKILLLTDSEKARLFFTKLKLDEALDALSKLCSWDIVRTKEAFATALLLWPQVREALQALHPPCDIPDWFRAFFFMHTQDGKTIREHLPLALAIICGWGSLERAAKAIKEASRESALNLTAASPIALASPKLCEFPWLSDDGDRND